MNGRLGAWELYTGTPQAVYLCRKTVATAVNLNICNRNNDSAFVSVAISNSATAPGNAEWIEFGVELLGKGVLERTGIVVSPGQYLIVKSNVNRVNAVCWGIEMGQDVVLPSVSQNLGSPPAWQTAATLPDVYASNPVSLQITATDPENGIVDYNIVSGSLPDGLTLSQTGVISGTPSFPGYIAGGLTSTVTIGASDSLNVTPQLFSITKQWADGSSAAKAIQPTASATTLTALSGQTSGDFWVKDLSGTTIQTKLYRYNNIAYVLMAGISDNTSHGQYTGGTGNWFGQWTNSSTFGAVSTANALDGYKNSLWFNGAYDDILVMQGFNPGSISSDFYANSTEVAFTNNTWLQTRGRNMANFFSGTNGSPNLNINGNANRTLIPLTFVKGTAAASESRYRGNSISELVPSNEIDFGNQNTEGYRFAVINALGCRSDGPNIEHHAWVGNTGTNYSNRNYSEPNWDGVWGINAPNSWLYWLWWARS